MKRSVVGVAAAIVAACLGAGAGEAQERPLAGQETVKAFRTKAQLIGEPAFSTGYAGGVAGFMNIVMECATSTSIGELRAYLLFGADADLTLWQALAAYSNRSGCTFKSIEAMRAILSIEGKR